MDPNVVSKAQQIIAAARREVGNCALGQETDSTDPVYPSIPGYEIVREIHRGGQGVVYEAVQDITRQRVAIKLLRHGMASSAVDRVRFTREAKILGRLRHPNIVTIHEAGVASGCQYFVMAYIPGESLDTYTRHVGLSIVEHVPLFLTICDAVGAAHQRAVLHRDLKPSNVHVDKQGRPHVLDFGLAADSDDVDSSLTITGQFIGSLPWASPEQAAGDSGEIDARTDVYALGLILFHMLTQQFPYGVVGPPSNVLDAIQNAQPIRPSAFRREVPHDLDQIILQCLSKEQARRYQSVSELAADLRRFLAHEPISARGDSTWYKLTKAVRRHPRATVVLVGVAALTVLYAVATTVLYRRAGLAESQARASAQEADEAARALEVVYENLLDRIAKLEDSPGTEAMRRELVAEAYRGLGELVKKKPGSRPTSASLAATLYRLGDFAVALGERDQALTYFREAAEIREELLRDQPKNLDLRAELSVNTVRIGDTLKELGDLPNGQAMYERALGTDQELVDASPNNPHFLDNLAWSYQRLGLLARDRGEDELAESYFREELVGARRAVELEPDNPVRLDTLLEAHLRQIPMLGSRELALGYAKIREQAAELRVPCDPSEAPAADALRTAEDRVVRARAHSHIVAQAMKPCVETARQAAQLPPNNPRRTRRLIETLRDYAYNADQAGLDEEATSAQDEALAVANNLVQADPGVVENLRLLARLHSWAIGCAIERSDFETALLHAQPNLRWCQTALKNAPADPTLLHEVYLAQHAVGFSLFHVGRDDEAQAAVEAAVTIAEQARDTGLMGSQFQKDYGRILTEPEALTFRDIDRGLNLMTQAIEAWRPDDVLLWEELGNAAASAGRMDFACSAYQHALKLDRTLPP